MSSDNQNQNQLCKEQIPSVLFKALERKYESDLATAQASVLIYMNSSVGIGEHPQHVEEMDKLIDTMADAEDKLDILRKYFGNYSANAKSV